MCVHIYIHRYEYFHLTGKSFEGNGNACKGIKKNPVWKQWACRTHTCLQGHTYGGGLQEKETTGEKKRKKTKSAIYILRLSRNSYHTVFGPLLLVNP